MCIVIPDFTVAHIQKNGFSTPILFREKSGLDIKVPKPDFTVADVRQCVGKYYITIYQGN